ncbi:hypothetical protein BDV37DRAFT_127939 [Aspergillus pseudonomiae]|uniref:Uncharacterized protein n=1 Tax=Aspergillus pseudonomiae TaxID=1506151 RepID=A0A5N7DC35_9EURO|nr:uncharacterized protein BDV37DRAFT_127939 [Aspergillus pseudonomiae]KAE8403794.1 hypothetical protein BDV37DRAFT_127939 [Aspergillus pseudonomiae]
MDSRDIKFKRSLKDLGSPTREPNAVEILSLGQASCDSGIPPLIPRLTRAPLWIFLLFQFFFFFFSVLLFLTRSSVSPLSDCSTLSHSVLMFLFPSQQIIMVRNYHPALLSQASILPGEHKKRTKYELLGLPISVRLIATLSLRTQILEIHVPV